MNQIIGFGGIDFTEDSSFLLYFNYELDKKYSISHILSEFLSGQLDVDVIETERLCIDI